MRINTIWGGCFYIKRVLPFLIRRLTRVLTVSESSKRDIVEYAGVPEKHVSVTPLAADGRVYFPRDAADCIKRMGPKYDIRKPYVLYLSRIEHPGKNHAGLVRAFSILKKTEGIPHQLVLAGSDWDRAEEVHRAAEESAYADDIVFTGFAPNSDLPDLYCGAELFVFPSLYEGFGLPVLEAMNCGVPVACSNISSIPEVIGDAGILFDPYDDEAIADAMRRLLTDPGLLKDCRERGLARARKFAWSATAALTLKVAPGSRRERCVMPADPHMIGIAGPSCSGKSEIAGYLMKQFSGMNPVVLTLDAYYHDLSHLDPAVRERRNFDVPEALNHELLREQLLALAHGNAIDKPVYDFATHTCSPQIREGYSRRYGCR